MLSPFYSSIKRRSSSPELPAYATQFLSPAIDALKRTEQEDMASPSFETAVLAYLLRTRGEVWKEEQAKAWRSKKQAEPAIAPEEAAAKKKNEVFSKCTWSKDKTARLKAMKESRNPTEQERFKAASAKEQFYAPTAIVDYNEAKKILDSDEPYKKSLASYTDFACSASVDATVTTAEEASAVLPDPMFD